MIKKLMYGPHEIRLSEDEDVAALAQRLADPAESPAKVIGVDGTTHWLVLGVGVPIDVIDYSTKRPGRGPIMVR